MTDPRQLRFPWPLSRGHVSLAVEIAMRHPVAVITSAFGGYPLAGSGESCASAMWSDDEAHIEGRRSGLGGRATGHCPRHGETSETPTGRPLRMDEEIIQTHFREHTTTGHGCHPDPDARAKEPPLPSWFNPFRAFRDSSSSQITAGRSGAGWWRRKHHLNDRHLLLVHAATPALFIFLAAAA